MSVLEKRTYKPADERREQILDCALSVFAQKGFHGTSIADVCACAGIGRATLYQYFDDKRDVLVALAERISTRVLTALAGRKKFTLPREAKVTEEEAIPFLDARFVHVLDAVLGDAASCRLVLRAGRGADGVVDDMLRTIDDALLAAIEEDLTEGQRAGLLRPLDVKFVARFFVGGLEKVVLQLLDEGRPVDVAALAREATLLELSGVLARKSPPPPRPKPQEGKRRR